MALSLIETTVILDLYDHDTTPATIKAIALDSKTRYVAAVIRNGGRVYDIGADTQVTLTVLRPDGVGAQVVGEPYAHEEQTPDEQTITTYGAYAELSQTALAVKGKCLAQFKLTSGEQVLRTEIFTINNGRALDADTTDWAGIVDGHNLDEMAQDIEDAKAAVSEMESDVSDLKEGLEDIIATAYVTESANGSVAHFTDGADNIPMKSVRIDTDATSGKVTRCGKNWLKLISKSGYTIEKYGIVLTLNDDGSWTLRGTSTQAITHTIADKNTLALKAGRYKLSGGISSDVSVRINVYDVIYESDKNDAEFEYKDGDFDNVSARGNVYIRVESGVTVDTTIYPMIRLASESDSYEPYKGDTYDVTIADGVVQEEITSLLGINNVWSDSGDIECEYRADTKLYIDKRLGV